jgi:hypothetical protein
MGDLLALRDLAEAAQIQSTAADLAADDAQTVEIAAYDTYFKVIYCPYQARDDTERIVEVAAYETYTKAHRCAKQAQENSKWMLILTSLADTALQVAEARAAENFRVTQMEHED